MLATIEAIIEKDGSVRLLENVHPTHATRALLTLLEPLQNNLQEGNQASLHSLIGSLKDSPAFSNDPVLLQQTMRNEWD